jgi:hypothetical protein
MKNQPVCDTDEDGTKRWYLNGKFHREDGPAIKFASLVTAYYHGSREKLTELRQGSYITPYPEDAVIFGAPWGSRDLLFAGGPAGRPPAILLWKPGIVIPEDYPIYLYRIFGPVKGAPTNTGAVYQWNKITVNSSTPVKLVKIIPSWKKELMPLARAD